MTIPNQLWTFDDATKAKVDTIFDRWTSTSTPGMTLGIFREDEIVYSAAYGMANLEHGIPLSPESIFHVASISKQFTAMCIALLAAEGLLDVDHEVRHYVPEVPDFGVSITLRHLIHHVSGLRDQWELLELAGWREEDLVTEKDVLHLVERQRALNFPPNSEYLYCNTGYTLLAAIVNRVSGKTLRQFADERIFQPLGMTRTHFHDDHAEIVPGRTQAYEPRPGGGLKISIPEFDVVGTTSLFTTVGDLAKWNGNFTSALVGTPELIMQNQTPSTFTDGKPMTYAWGLATAIWRGVDRIGHAGADHGYRANYQRFPKLGLGIAVLSNVSDSNPGGLLDQVAEAILGDLLQPVEAAGTTTSVQSNEPSSLAGAYRNASGHDWLTITNVDGEMMLDTSEGPRPLVLDGLGRFTCESWATLEVVDVADDGRANVIRQSTVYDSAFTEFIRLPDSALTAADLAAYAGSYWSDELETPFRIVSDSSASELTWVRRKHPDQYLIALEADRFGRGGGVTVLFGRGADGRVNGFQLSSSRVRNLVFDRKE